MAGVYNSYLPIKTAVALVLLTDFETKRKQTNAAFALPAEVCLHI